MPPIGRALRQIPPAHGANQNIKGGESPKVTRASAGKNAGLSPDQTKDAMRVASVSDESFEAQIESDKPPSITALAKHGTKKTPYNLEGVDAAAHIIGSRLLGIIRRVIQETNQMDIEQAARGIKPSEMNQLLLDIQEAEAILRRIYLELAKKEK